MEPRFKGHLVDELYKDYRIKEGMKACMNCGGGVLQIQSEEYREHRRPQERGRFGGAPEKRHDLVLR